MSQISIGVIAIALLLAAGACGKSEQESEGPAEKAGATLGKAIDQAAEKASEALKEGAEKAKEGVSEALDKMKDKK
ncbi:MAG TPA: hypothetical protein VNM15_08090 [Candidatus Binatia bacterium]|nr:hypothetical protein [Candidatus Binatia bacterium]